MTIGDANGSVGDGWMVNEMIEDAISDLLSDALQIIKNKSMYRVTHIKVK